MSDSISALISHFGSQTATAKVLGVSQPTVSYWLSGQQRISPEKAILAQMKSNGAVLASDLCPLIAELAALQTLNESSPKSLDSTPRPDGAVILSSGAQ
ncbi:Cro/CI family transcriptional regulator [Pseudomonas sp. NFR16]|uniref:transcriptional regulator n=1 Tax=Pseudomonas sp. NFR16 TaxID=1566248 RepID=UPI000B81BE9C|nr:Cro/CI family transcriptional regulator [Pseudomonas sp. NFR16]